MIVGFRASERGLDQSYIAAKWHDHAELRPEMQATGACSGADNVFGILPRSSTKVAAVWLMIVHQFIAFSLYVLPLLFMW